MQLGKDVAAPTENVPKGVGREMADWQLNDIWPVLSMAMDSLPKGQRLRWNSKTRLVEG